MQFAFSVAFVIVTQWSQAFKTTFVNKIETFNMVVQVLLIYMLMCFSDFTDGPVIRHELGKVFVGILSGFIIVHVVIMTVNLCLSIKRSCKKRAKRRMRQKIASMM